jgi:proline racemase
MELPPFIQRSAVQEIKIIEMHTSGEPTRIVYSGFPDLPYAIVKDSTTMT